MPYFICDMANAGKQQSERHLTVVVNYATGNTCLLASGQAHPEWIREQSICNETNKDMAHSTISMLQCWPLSPQLVAAPRTAWQRLKKITLSGWGVSRVQPSDCNSNTPTCWSCSDTTHASGTKSKGSFGTWSDNQGASVVFKTNRGPKSGHWNRT